MVVVADVWHVSLLGGPLLVAVRVVGPGALLGGGVLAWRWSRRRFAAVLAATMTVVVTVDWVRRVSGVLAYRHPWSFHLWAGRAVFGLLLGAAYWPRGAWRSGWVLMVMLFVVFAVASVNAQYAYWPTLGDLAGRPMPHQGRFVDVVATVRTPAPTVPAVSGSGSADPAGRVVSIRIPAPRSGFRHRREWVWLPPAWFAPRRPPLPVLVMLAGTPGRPDDWLRAGGAASVAAVWAAGHGGNAPILVFPDHNGSFAGDTECVDGPRGKAETYLTEDVPRWVVASLGASPDPTRWGVVGLSEGGTCALNLVLGHPDRFRTAVDLSGDVVPNAGSPARTLRVLYGGDPGKRAGHILETLFGRASPATSLWLASGRSDHRARRAVATLASLARGSGLQPAVWDSSGGHNFFFWARALQVAFPWAAAQVSA